jgi:CHASE2 domain-containing sensor protein
MRIFIHNNNRASASQCVMCMTLFLAMAFAGMVYANTNANTSTNTKTPPFQLVMIDAATEAKLGAFPIDRAHVAKAVDALTKAGAKAIVLKFFYDQPSSVESDDALQKALRNSNVLLQARIDDTEPKPNQLPNKFYIPSANASTTISGNSGWLPLPSLANAAAAIGFVDTTDVNVAPAIIGYQGKVVPSLTVATIQAALDSATLQLSPGKFIQFAQHRLAIDKKNQILLSANALDEKNNVNKIIALSFIDLLSGNFLPADIKGKVIVVGYDGSKSPRLKTNFAETKVHRIFYLGLIDAWRQLQ